MKESNPIIPKIPAGSRVSPKLETDAAAPWRTCLRGLSLFAGAASLIATQPGDSVADTPDQAPMPLRIAKKARNSGSIGSCSKPELLRRQSEYRLPHQRGTLDLTRIETGGDNCPGTVIPAGTYTAASPYTDSGDTSGALNSVGASNCFYPYYYYYGPDSSGPDHIYTFTLTGRGANPQITVSTTSATYNPQIYILNGLTGDRCPIGNNNYARNCVFGSDRSGNGGAEIVNTSQVRALPLNVPLHLFIDSDFTTGPNSAGPYTLRMEDVTVSGTVTPPTRDAPLDLNGDGKTDFVVVRNTGGGTSGQMTWYTRTSSNGFTSPFDWGVASDKFVSGDFDGDGKDDIAVWRPGAQGRFYILGSRNQAMIVEDLGQTGDDPTVVGDYTGDGIDDLAVYRPGASPGAQSFWYYRPIGSSSFTTIAWGQNGDKPLPGDYDGDFRWDFVVRREAAANGRFFFRYAYGYTRDMDYGQAGDKVVSGDFDGDGYPDIAVVRTGSDGILVWDIDTSSSGSQIIRRFWGVAATDIIAPGDYNGDGRSELAVWRPGNPGSFFILDPISGAISVTSWGQTGDYPVANFRSR